MVSQGQSLQCGMVEMRWGYEEEVDRWQQLKVKWKAASSNEERGSTNIGSLTVKAEMREGLYSYLKKAVHKTIFLDFN